MRKFIWLLLTCVFPYCLHAQIDSIKQRIFLVGDAGELHNGTIPVVDWLRKHVDWNDEKNSLIYLGDNIYEAGLPLEGAPDYRIAKSALDFQIDLLRGKKSKGYFILGNHDWKGGTIEGWQRAVNQVNYINGQLQPNISAHPHNGCPGPVTVELSDQVVIVLMDSQWFLHLHDKPGLESTCEARTIDEFTAELRQIVLSHPNQLLLLAMHHPMYTYGTHGGAYTLKSHIFPMADAHIYVPLPILGSIYPVARGVFGTLQDTYHPLYRTMRNELENVLKEHPNVVTAAGHEHSLQLIQKDSIYHIVSGSASKLTRLRKGRRSLFSVLDYGFTTLEVHKSGKTEVRFYTLKSSDLNAPLYTRELRTITTTAPKSNTDTLRPLPATITIAPNPGISDNGYKHLVLGKNYRSEWRQAITVPVLDIGKEAGGLRPVRQTGSEQFRTLWLEEKSGKRWVLRPVGRIPIGAIPADLRQSSKTYTVEALTGIYPYADLSVSPLISAAGVPLVRKKLVFVPDDPRFERYRSDFKSTLAILEEEQPAQIKKTISTDDLYLLLAKDPNNIVDQKRVLQTRLLENFVMDFDRSERQYTWASFDSAGYKVHYPIPRDHEYAFFLNEGLYPRLVRTRWFIPQIQGFDETASNIRTFNYQARNFDHAFLNQLSRADWERQIDLFLSQMTDDALQAAIAEQPKEIQSYRAQEIFNTLQDRRRHFRKEMLDYYEFLSDRVKVVGSNARELFVVQRTADRSVRVTVQGMGKNTTLRYDREFDASITDEIELYGLEDNDSFVVLNGPSPVKLRLVGGPGKDAFAGDAGGKYAVLYDVSFDSNKVYGNGFINRISEAPENNTYNRQDYRYDYTRSAVWLEYNADDGFKGNALVQTTLHSFRRLPYASNHQISFNYAPYTRSFNASYLGDYRNVYQGKGLLVAANVRAPYTSNFFGYGSDTKIDLSKPDGLHHYRASYAMGDFSIYVAKQLQSWMRVGVGPTFQFLNIHEDKNLGRHISEYTSAPTVDTRTKLYAGADAILQMDSRNSEVLPTRGAALRATARPMLGLHDVSQSLAQIAFDLRIFMSFVPNTPFVIGTRFGAGHNFGHFEFPQAQYLSGTENLRGYRRNRFAGRTMMFNNTEFRLKLANFDAYLFRGALGVLAFHDIGKVKADGKSASQWHNGYGGGIWYSPVKRTVIVGTLGFSPEERFLPLLSFGFQF